MEHGPVIVESDTGDVRELAEIEEEAFRCPWPESLLRQEQASTISHLLVARSLSPRDGRIAGYMVYWLVADEFHLHRIAVRRDLRRQGIASALLAEAFHRSRERGIRRATLEVRRSNLGALTLYGKFGFAVKGVRPKYYDDNGEDALILWADLPLAPEPAPAASGKESRGG